MVRVQFKQKRRDSGLSGSVLGLTWVVLMAVFLWLAFMPTSILTQLAVVVPIVIVMALTKTFNSSGNNSIVRLLLITLALFVSVKYLAWRMQNTLPPMDSISFVPAILLLFAELYAFWIYVLGVVVNANPYRRKPIPLPDDVERLPSVDVFIPTYNEDVELLRTTLIAASRIDYPAELLTVYILDDGGTAQKLNDPDMAKRAQAQMRARALQELCARFGVRYLTRERNIKAKAGNINSALEQTDSDLILILDADHVPTRNILQNTVGCFLEDDKLFLVQTPHFFANPDPLERNLGTFGQMPSESEMFYNVIQLGLDSWNASFFCGSAAVLRRDYLMEVGGIAEETITEDCETALELHARGYNSAYINENMVAGLQPETFQGFIVQRTRWTQGMIQLLLLKNPLFKRGLTIAQKLCYLSSNSFWLFPFARLMFLLSPLAYLFFGLHIYRCTPQEFLAYTLPHLIVSMLLSNQLFGRTRWTFISELYELIQAVYTAKAVIKVFMNPRHPSFAVTPKGETLDDEFLSPLARPFYIIYFVLISGLIAGYWRYLAVPHELDIILVVSFWNVLNILMIGAALGVMVEARQRRRWPRLPVHRSAALVLDGTAMHGTMEDLSHGGGRLLIAANIAGGLMEWPDRGEIEVELASRGRVSIAVEIRSAVLEDSGVALGLQFRPENDTQLGDLVELFYSDSRNWAAFQQNRKPAPGVLVGLVKFLAMSLKHSAIALTFPLLHRAKVSEETRKKELRITPARFKSKSRPVPPANEQPASKVTPLTPPSLAGGVGVVALGVALALMGGGKAAAQLPPADLATSTIQSDQATENSPAPVSLELPISRWSNATAVIRLAGEYAKKSLDVVLPPLNADGRVDIILTFSSSVQNLPEASTLALAINGTAVATLPSNAYERPRSLAVRLPATFFRPGVNSVTLTAEHLHRVDCTVEASYELFTDILAEQSRLVIPPEALAKSPPDTADLDGQIALQALSGAPLPIYMLANTSPNARLEVATLVAQSYGLRLGGQAAPVAAHLLQTPVGASATDSGSPGEALFPGMGPDSLSNPLSVVIGTRDQLRAIVAPSILTSIVGRSAHIYPVGEGPLGPRAVLLLSGVTETELVQAAEQFAQAQGHVVSRLQPHQEYTLSELGYESVEFAGHRLVTDIPLMLEPDLFPGTDQPVELILNLAYAAGMSTDALLGAAINGKPVSSLRMDNPSGLVINAWSMRFPSDLLRPGRNMLRLEALMPRADAGTCIRQPGAEGRRFALFADSTIRFPAVPHTGRQPNVRLLAQTGYPLARARGEMPTRLTLADEDDATLSAALTFIARVAQGNGAPLAGLVFTHQDSAEENRLLVGPTNRLPKLLLDAIPLVLPGANAEAFEPPSAFHKAMGVDLLVQRPADAQQPSSAADIAASTSSAQAKIAANEMRAQWTEQLSEQSNVISATLADPERLQRLASAFVKQLVPTLLPADPLGDYLPASSHPTLQRNVRRAGEAVLVGFATPGTRRATTYVLSAETPAILLARVQQLVEPQMWNSIEGNAIAWAEGDTAVTYAAPSKTYLTGNWPHQPVEASLLASTWLARNPAVTLGIVVAVLLLLAGVAKAWLNTRVR
jgi:cellulose synthase (UDP-forming)